MIISRQIKNPLNTLNPLKTRLVVFGLFVLNLTENQKPDYKEILCHLLTLRHDAMSKNDAIITLKFKNWRNVKIRCGVMSILYYFHGCTVHKTFGKAFDILGHIIRSNIWYIR